MSDSIGHTSQQFLAPAPFLGIAHTLGQFAEPVRQEAPASDVPCVRSLLVRAVRAESREADFVFSSDRIDSYGDRVEQVWQLERFLANPVALFAHDSRSLPIGRATQVGVVDGKLHGTIVFASAKANPVAEQVWQSLQEGTLRAVSVGFIPHSVRVERENDRDVYVLSDNELLEISVVPIPANADALMRLRQKAAPAAQQRTTMAEKPATTEPISQAPAVALEASLADTTARCAALDLQNKALVAERDAAVARATAAESRLVELEVDALVGVKITPAERDAFVELAKRDRELFGKFVAQRAPMTILRRDPAGMGPDAPSVATTAETLTDNHGDAFARLAQERAGR
jgi:HK97 family phage prohead protease